MMDNDDDDNNESTSIIVRSIGQQMAIAISGRIGAGISFFSGLYIVITVLCSRRNRSRIYHRLMLGIAINIIIVSIGDMWGPTSVPKGTEGVFGAMGNVTTCSIRGFWNQLQAVVPMYYDGLAVYSLVAMHYNFKVIKYAWIEKYIHIGVYIFPVSSAIYLLSIDAFNFNGSSCGVAGVPINCGEHNDIVCTRGPQNISQIHWLFVGLPSIVVMIFPTIVMAGMYAQHRWKLYKNNRSGSTTKSNQEEGELEGRQQRVVGTLGDHQHQNHQTTNIGQQMSLYLLALYWTYFFSALHTGLLVGAEKDIFVLYLSAHIVIHLQGLWILLVYVFFARLQQQNMRIRCSNRLNGGELSSSMIKGISSSTLMKIPSSSIAAATNDDVKNSITNTISTYTGSERENNNGILSNMTVSNNNSDFAIYDGSNPSNVWRDFIFDGEDEDYIDDKAEAEKWKDVIQT